MRTRTALVLVAIAALAVGAFWYFVVAPSGSAGPAAEAPGTVVFDGLAPKLGTATRVEITSKGQTLVIAKAGDVWGLADHGTYRVQPDRLRELLTGLTELRITELRTSDPALLERLGLGDPASAASTAVLVRVLDGNGKPLAELVVGHRRVRTQGNLPETIYVRHPDGNQAWLAEGQLPVDADPQLWLDRDIANIDSKRVASVVVHRGDAVLAFARDGDKFVLKAPAEHPKLDEYRVEDVSRALESLTLTDVKPAAQEQGGRLGTATITLTDGTVVDVTVFGVAKPGAKEPTPPEIWIQLAVRGESEEAKKLAARVTGWAYQVGSWKEKAFVPTLDDLKAEEKPVPAPAEAAPPAAAPATEPVPAPPAPAATGTTETAPAAPATTEEKKP